MAFFGKLDQFSAGINLIEEIILVKLFKKPNTDVQKECKCLEKGHRNTVVEENWSN